MKPDQLEHAHELAARLTATLRAAHQDAISHGTQVEVMATYDLIEPAERLQNKVYQLHNAVVFDQEEVAPTIAS